MGKQHFAALALMAVLAAAPILGLSNYDLDILAEICIFAIGAVSLDLLLGFGGLVSFGHAAFFGVGAYGAMLLNVDLGWNPWAALAGGIVLAGGAASLIGAFCVRVGGPSFFMLTLAFAQLLNSGAIKWRKLTGGSDGMGGLPRPALFGFDASDSRIDYLLCFGLLVLVLLLLRRLIASPFGRVLVGIRENELRMTALGYRTGIVKWAAFTISGAVAGLAGGLYAAFNSFVSPDVLSWGTSGTMLLMVVLGGAGTLYGPVIGSLVFLLAKEMVSSHTEHWLLIVGIIFVACVMFFPKGVYGLMRRHVKVLP